MLKFPGKPYQISVFDRISHLLTNWTKPFQIPSCYFRVTFSSLKFGRLLLNILIKILVTKKQSNTRFSGPALKIESKYILLEKLIRFDAPVKMASRKNWQFYHYALLENCGGFRRVLLASPPNWILAVGSWNAKLIIRYVLLLSVSWLIMNS